MPSNSPTPASSFDVLTGFERDPVLTAAARATTRAVDDETLGVVVVVVRPDTEAMQVISGGGTGVLRAAVSVAAAAGNDRLWRDAPHGDTVECDVRSLPEVIAAAAGADGVRTVHTGCVRHGSILEAIAIWFETWNGVAAADERRRTLAELEQAAALAREELARMPAPADEVVDAGEEPRTWDADDPTLDPLTGVLTADAFADRLAEFEGDEATMLLVDVDAFDDLTREWGDSASDAVLRIVLDRMLASLRRDDVVARVEHDRFAVLLGDVDRSSVIQIAKRILAQIAEPLPAEVGPSSVTATMALAHQVGLVDVDEMLDSAVAAVASGQRSGAGKLVLAA